jgi:hypothetical protein
MKIASFDEPRPRGTIIKEGRQWPHVNVSAKANATSSKVVEE